MNININENKFDKAFEKLESIAYRCGEATAEERFDDAMLQISVARAYIDAFDLLIGDMCKKTLTEFFQNRVIHHENRRRDEIARDQKARAIFKEYFPEIA